MCLRIPAGSWGVALVVASTASACGGATDSGSPADAGLGDASTGGQGGSGGGASGGAETGGAGVGGTGGSEGGAGGGGVSCLGAAGVIALPFKACNTTSDCTQVRVPTCCGSDGMSGIARTATCTIPSIDCSGLGCAKFLFPMADDGQTTENGGTIDVRCEPSDAGTRLCRTFVTQADAGSTACGATTCAADELCIHPPTSVGGPAPPCIPTDDAGQCPPAVHHVVHIQADADIPFVEAVEQF